ncbi:MAG: hypothetical protein WBF17_06575 [Phycisphaerae bacterium]
MEAPDGTASAFVGSHNMTGFALGGMNGEASVLLEGPSTEAVFEQIRFKRSDLHAFIENNRVPAS